MPPHRDSMDGPVVGAARQALDTGNVNLIFAYVPESATAEVESTFDNARCEDCAYTTIAYSWFRKRHCPKCQGAAAKEWLAAREADLQPEPYYHVVFTLPAPIADIAHQNKAVVYDFLFKASAETMLTIAADPKHLGGRIGITSVLHTWARP